MKTPNGDLYEDDEKGVTGGAYDWVDDESLSLEEVKRRFDAAWAAGRAVKVLRPVGYQCEHMNITTGGFALSQVTCWHGCHMKPVFPAETTA